MNIQTKKEAKAIIISLSNTSKMPGKSYGLPALKSCPTGAKLAAVPGSVCSDCYACKGMYSFHIVQSAQSARMDATKHPNWVTAMVVSLKGLKFFRWHDSGDIYSYEYLLKIIEVVVATPTTKHWLPTREKRIIRRYLKDHKQFPKNLVVRVSYPMIDKSPPPGKTPKVPDLSEFPNTSSVHEAGFIPEVECKAYTRGGKCGPCRKCWNKSVNNVSYPIH